MYFFLHEFLTALLFTGGFNDGRHSLKSAEVWYPGEDPQSMKQCYIDDMDKQRHSHDQTGTLVCGGISDAVGCELYIQV